MILKQQISGVRIYLAHPWQLYIVLDSHLTWAQKTPNRHVRPTCICAFIFKYIHNNKISNLLEQYLMLGAKLGCAGLNLDQIVQYQVEPSRLKSGGFLSMSCSGK